MSEEFDAEQLDAEFGLTKDLDIACEYTCPACHTRREVVFKDFGEHGSFPCPCGGFSFAVDEKSFAEARRQLDKLAGIFKKLGK